jgi:hypothetical protein
VRRGRGSSIRVRRATIIMASSSGTAVAAIARLVAADEDTVRDVIHAFNERGLAALDPRWAGGRPRQDRDPVDSSGRRDASLEDHHPDRQRHPGAPCARHPRPWRISMSAVASQRRRSALRASCFANSL